MDAQPKYIEERSRVMVGTLPNDFLRINSSPMTSNNPCQINETNSQLCAQPNASTQISICIVQAQLAKNYSITKMDPYVRLRIGHTVFETHSDMRGGKLPNWNKTITSYLPPGIKTLHIEVYDEKTLTPDERIASGDFTIPEEAFQGKYIDTWVPLSGKQGPEKEGSINITLYLRSVPYWSSIMPSATPLMVVPQPAVMPYYFSGQPMAMPYAMQPMQNPNYPYTAPHPQPVRPTEEEVQQLQDMFPDFDKEVILGVLENSRGNKEGAITSLLALSDK